MSRTIRLALLSVLAGAGLAAPAVAQGGNYATAVAAGNNELFVAEPLNQYEPGAVYVYRPSAAGKWTRTAVLHASDASNFDHFGRALGLAGNTLLIGATEADSGRGAVYVFTKDKAGAWKETGRLSAPDGAKDDGFGRIITVSGHTALVSALGHDSARGAVYAFQESGGKWAPAGVLKSADVNPNEGFGGSVALVGDLAFVGASQRDSAAGAVFVFKRSGNDWTQDTTIALRNADPRTMFGNSLLADGDRLLIGAPGAYTAAGAVFIYQQDSTTHAWRGTDRLLPFDGARAMFGASMVMAGNELWIGAPLVDRGNGAVFRMQRDKDGHWIAARKMTGPDSLTRAQFGSTMALAGSHAVIGLTGADFGAGQAMLLNRSAAGTWAPAASVHGEAKGLASIIGARVDCHDDKAKIFDCSDVDLLSFMPLKDIGAGRGVVVNDNWGWTDPETGREYALVGRIDGTSFVDITDPSHPKYLGNLPKTAKANVAIWRDMKTYKHYVYIVADGAGDHGMQVFDLYHLRNVKTPQTFTEDYHYDKIHSAHNIVIDTASGFAYTVGNSSGGETCGGGLHMIDIREPLHPKFAGCFADPSTGRAGTGYIHDAQCVMYHGPDKRYDGHEICFNAAETALSIADVTDKSNPVALAHSAYPNVGYAHQGWLTGDQKYFYMDDELDELEGKTDGTRTLIWDVSDLTDPVLAGAYVSKDKSSDHNLYIKGDLMFQSNYLSGLRVVDISDRLHPKQVGYFDTVPVGEDVPGFGGSWSNYPFFKSGTIIVTSGDEGLFMVQKHPQPMTP
ncbi:MAG TPA: choice-of-anchor B family protein [Gemmatimonadales bacterium]|nr:choice-of-anchor B family protein [Gemmatimonadales bacterium]